LVQTSIWGEGYATIFSCEAILTDQGSWSQTWDPTPPPVEGGFTLTGSWGAWTLVAEGPNFHGVGKLTVGPNDPAPVTACVKNNLQSVTMLGTMEFVDP
jgi:hypothetical protein